MISNIIILGTTCYNDWLESNKKKQRQISVWITPSDGYIVGGGGGSVLEGTSVIYILNLRRNQYSIFGWSSVIPVLQIKRVKGRFFQIL